MKRSLILTLLLLGLALAARARSSALPLSEREQGKNYVVLVGIADYPGTQNDLKVSAQDAVTMKTLYERNDDAVTEMLTDAQATVENVKVTLGNLFARATRHDAIILFFSGHGVPGGFVCYNGLLRYSDITAIMSRSEAQTKMVFADACFAGKARNSKKRDDRPSDTSVLFFLSSRTNEKSQERRGWRNSLFTAYLERGLRGGADNDRNRTITARELFDFVSKGVAKDSREKQHPVMWGKFDDQLPLMVWKEKSGQ